MSGLDTTCTACRVGECVGAYTSMKYTTIHHYCVSGRVVYICMDVCLLCYQCVLQQMFGLYIYVFDVPVSVFDLYVDL